jgi:tRNA 2-thiouridine synthesizing protein A
MSAEQLRQNQRRKKMIPAPAVTLDVRNLGTPEPCLEVAAAIERLEPGEVIEVLNNDPFSVSDIIRWCSYEGVEHLELRYLPHGVDRFLLRKPLLNGAARGASPSPEPVGVGS